MLKKLDISEKLKKISDDMEKKGPLLKPKRISKKETKYHPQNNQSAKEKISGSFFKDENEDAVDEFLLLDDELVETPKKASYAQPDPFESKTKVTIEGSMEEFLITEQDGVKIKPKYHEVNKDSIEQVFLLIKKKPIELKWTVVKDSFAEEFSLLTRELKLVKTSPPIYASEFENARIVASHVGLYSITLGSYYLELDDLIKLFIKIIDSKFLK